MNKPIVSSPRIYYGWWNVLGSFTGQAFSHAMFTLLIFGVFLKPLAEEFGWQRDEMSVAFSITNLTVVLSAIMLGFLIDRFGVRRIVLPSLILMGLAIASMSQLTGNIYHFYLMYFLIPFLGAGNFPTSYSRVIVNWFFRRRGIALGIALTGFGIGAAFFPPFSQMIITDYGWREAYLVLAVLVLVVGLPVIYFTLRDDPSEMGMAIDGKPLQNAAEGKAKPALGLSLKEAALTRSFWLILLAFMLVGVALSGIFAHLVPMLTDRGISKETAALCQTALGLSIMFGRLTSGWLMDRFFAPYVAATFTLMTVIGLIILATGTSSYLVFIAAIAIGLSAGSEISETAYLVSRYFGPIAFGVIYGLMYAGFQLGAAAGAYYLGRHFVINGNYEDALWVLAGLVFIGAVLVASLEKYPKLEEQQA